jgi:hypothetical protein
MKPMRSPFRSLLAIFIASCFSLGSANAYILLAPNLPSTTFNHTNTGIVFTALTNATITEFVYRELGNADTLQLQTGDGLTVLETVNSFNGSGFYTFNVDWDLVSGTSYRLVAIFAPFEGGSFGAATFPIGNADISVTSGILSNNVNSSFWGGFTSITTIPEPSTSVLMMVALLGYLGSAKLRRRLQ